MVNNWIASLSLAILGLVIMACFTSGVRADYTTCTGLSPGVTTDCSITANPSGNNSSTSPPGRVIAATTQSITLGNAEINANWQPPNVMNAEENPACQNYTCSASLGYSSTQSGPYGPPPSTQDTVSVSPASQPASGASFTIAATLPDPGYYQVSLSGGSTAAWVTATQPTTQYSVVAYGTTQPANLYVVPTTVNIVNGSGIVTNQSLNTVVGSAIALNGVVVPADAITPATTQWSLSDTAIKSYTQTTSKGATTQLATHGDLDQQGIIFYWIDGGNKTAQFKVSVLNKSMSAKVTYNVARPTATLSSIVYTGAPPNPSWNPNGTPVYIGTNAWGGPSLTFGTGVQPGITWTGDVTAGSNFGGSLEICQLVSANDTETFPGNSLQWNSGGYVLDNPVPYGQVTTSVGVGITESDTPSTSLSGGMTQAVRNDSFETYLMYQPPGGIWVTLDELDWSWGGTATLGNGGWVLTNPTSPSNGQGSNSTQLPQWSNYFTNIQPTSQP